MSEGAGVPAASEGASEAEGLQLVRAEIDIRQFQGWMGIRRFRDQDHAMHCLLVECFGDLAPKPFRLIVPRGGSTGVLYGYSTSTAEVMSEAAGISADPLQSRILPVDRLDSKAMPSRWQAGKRLGFETRIRPIKRRSRRNAGTPSGECDAFLWQAALEPRGGMKLNREEVYARWLSEQFDRIGGAILEIASTRLVSFQRSRAFRNHGARHSEGPDASMRGILTVTDPARFPGLLARGIGRHRAYGYGMLLLRPART